MSLTLPKIAIIILNWNGLKDTIACIDSVSAIDYPHFEIILVDNGSTDGSVSVIRDRFPHVHCIALERNLGFAAGNNVGIEYALKSGFDLILLLNNDTVVAPDLLHRFVDGFASEPQAGILGARIYLFSAKDTLDHLGGMWIKKEAKMHLIGFREKDPTPLPSALIPLDYVCGACMIIKRSVFESIGMLEPRYFLYWEENDFCLRAKRAGFLCFSSPEARIWHKVSASIVGGRPHATYFIWRGRLLWIERHYSSLEKRGIYCRVIFPAFFKLVKFQLLKRMQLCLLRLFRPHADFSAREKKLRDYSAALAGIRDYVLKRFDQGPDWIYKKKI
jgi:GT2 family glycosyltransferase